MEFVIATDPATIKKADDLLYEVLWKPFNISSNTREYFKTGAPELIFAALQENRVTGAFVLVVYSPDYAEIRHAAVSIPSQGQGTGRKLCRQVLSYAEQNQINRIEVYARDTALGFWTKMGFKEESDWVDHELFIKHGIRFKKMAVTVVDV